jgi:hypothetical protein
MSAHPFQIIDIVWRREKTGRGGVMRTVTSRGNDEACETRPLLTGQKQMTRNTNCSPPIILSNKHQTIRTEGRCRCLSRHPKPKGKISCRALLSAAHLCSPNPRYRTSTASSNACLRGRLGASTSHGIRIVGRVQQQTTRVVASHDPGLNRRQATAGVVSPLRLGGYLRRGVVWSEVSPVKPGCC